MKDINKELVMGLRDVSHAMRGLYEGKGSQKRVLMVLQETGKVSQRELTQRLGIQPGSVSEVIGKLEGAGLVSRTESESDRRTVDLELTEEGAKRAEEARAQRVQRHKEMFTVLSDEEKEAFLIMLQKINEDWKTRFADRKHDHHHHHHHQHGHDHHHPHEQEEHEGQHGGCNHDCANCTHPCPKGRARLEGSR